MGTSARYRLRFGGRQVFDPTVEQIGRAAELAVRTRDGWAEGVRLDGSVLVATHIGRGQFQVTASGPRGESWARADGLICGADVVDLLIAHRDCDGTLLGERIKWRWQMPTVHPPVLRDGQLYRVNSCGDEESADPYEMLRQWRRIVRNECILGVLLVACTVFALALMATEPGLVWWKRVPALGFVATPVIVLHLLNWRCPFCFQRLSLMGRDRCRCRSLCEAALAEPDEVNDEPGDE